MEVAGIQYMGESGATTECKNAILRFIQFGDEIDSAIVLTCNNAHAFLLTVNGGELVAIKSGFSSEYRGEGPRGFSHILHLFLKYSISLRESNVSEALFGRLDHSALTNDDLEFISGSVRSVRWDKYLLDDSFLNPGSVGLWKELPIVVPFSIIDPRLHDLALHFREHPDEKLLTAFRRLEDIVRRRCEINEHGAKLFSQAFKILKWDDVDESEKNGRISLFTGTYMTFRNPRAHKEIPDNLQNLLLEFLAVNQLYILEAKSVKIDKPSASTTNVET